MPSTKHAGGYSLRRGNGSSNYAVIYWDKHAKKQREKSTGCSDIEAAEKEAARIYAEYLTRPPEPAEPKVDLPLSKVAGEYLEANQATWRGPTFEGLFGYYERLAKEWPSLLDVTTPSVRNFIGRRLQEVTAKSVAKDLSALRTLMNWAAEQGKIEVAPIIPSVRKRVLGTPYSERRRVAADVVTVDEVQKLLDSLPEFSDRASPGSHVYPIRPRFVLQYEHALRPETVDKLASADHWRPGQETLILDPYAMKESEQSRKTLTPPAKEALEIVYRKPGLLFGKHKHYGEYIFAAASKVLDPLRAGRFTMQHFRSIRLSHLAAMGMSAGALMAFADHADLSTTSRYIRPSETAATDELRRLGLVK